MTLQLHDTLSGKVRPFVPRTEGAVSLYVCGVTVQSAAHIGHGRSAVAFDVLRRYLTYRGFAVTHVVNITDIDDKIITRASLEDVPTTIIAEKYSRLLQQGLDALGVLPPHIQPRATAHIIEIQQMITTLIEQDKAYERDGSVFFRVRAFPDYGKLSNRELDDMQQGEDGLALDKDDPVDFAMWKAAKPGEPAWASPWGDGRPGWHIECSAMAAKHLGAGFDIHGGGNDLVFPHHENEIAQYEAAHGGTFANYWLHNGMLRMGESKMSKSLGNIVSLVEAAEQVGAGPLRHWYVSAHYRSPLTYDEERLAEAATAHGRLATFIRSVRLLAGDAEPDAAVAAPFVAAFEAAMDDDINTSGALASLFDLVGHGNELLGKARAGDAAARSAVAGLAQALLTLGDDVLGLHLDATLASADAIADRLRPLVDDLIERRGTARADKDWATADRIRDQLAAAGVVVEDGADGAFWYVDAAPKTA